MNALSHSIRTRIPPLLGLALLLFAGTALAAPRVVVSIQPIHALVSGVMDGVAEPELLLAANASPHDYAMRPSDMRRLQQADLVIHVGEALETFLERPLEALPERVERIELLHDAALHTLPLREGGVWERHEHAESERGHEHDHDHEHEGVDAHIWLSPENARRIVRHVADVLARLDAPNAARYEANAGRLLERIDAMDRRLGDALTAVKDRPYILFHDAYHYFEDHYGLTPAGSITVDPSRAPGAKRLREIRARIQATQAICVFSEPQFKPAIVATLIEGTGARTGVLDPIGSTLPPGTDAWFRLMDDLAANLRACLLAE
ncbi:MAG: zinc ABC transporter substrate-binding protein ZnuA [Chromatiales bacterium]|nr:zinc ABC transporter substrate-binding protein ZnuA [Chromatiales bacterium]